jgi:hypothetical protein
MKTSVRLQQLLTGSILLASTSFTFAGTWSDAFSGSVLGSDWRGDRAYFSIMDGALDGISAEPVAPVPLHQVEVGTNWGDYTVQCRIDVVTPNLLICTKGALILRDDGKDGYVFALHVATKTIEVYRLSDHEILLSQDAPLELQTWYLVRAELRGTNMSFFVDGQLIGAVTDDRSLFGAVGVAVQDTMQTLFDDFTVTGPGIPSNRLALSVGQKITLSWPSFLTNYVLKTTSDLSATSAWSTVTNTPVSLSGQLTVTSDSSPGNHFYVLAPKSPLAGVPSIQDDAAHLLGPEAQHAVEPAGQSDGERFRERGGETAHDGNQLLRADLFSQINGLAQSAHWFGQVLLPVFSTARLSKAATSMKEQCSESRVTAR